MGNYAKRDARAREMIEFARRARIAKGIEGLPNNSLESFGVWLFCAWCGNRKIADAEWFFNRAKECDHPLEQLASRVCCSQCRAKGVHAILAPVAIQNLRVTLLSREGRALLLSEERVIVE